MHKSTQPTKSTKSRRFALATLSAVASMVITGAPIAAAHAAASLAPANHPTAHRAPDYKAALLPGGKATAAARGQFIGELLVSFMMPAMGKVQQAEDRSLQTQNNLAVAFALAWYQRDHGRYPKTLDVLAPKYLPKVPGDLFSSKALVYRPAEKGYLLYSVGIDGVDNEGRRFSDDPPGETFWKVSNGIRLSGMPAYHDVLSETQIWQVSLLLANADKPLPTTAAGQALEPPDSSERASLSAACVRWPVPPTRSMDSLHVAIVDQVIENPSHVAVRFDDPGLLECEACAKNSIALRLADFTVGEIGAFAQLPLHHVFRQLGGGDEALLDSIFMSKRICATGLIHCDDPPDEIRIVPREIFAHVENAIGICVGIAIEQTRAVAKLGLGHHRIEPRPRIHIAA